jgi:hypothetical protein
MRRIDGEPPRVLSQTPGRLRVHLPAWHDGQAVWIEDQLRAVPGVEAVQANALTGNVLVHFDPQTITGAALLAALAGPEAGPAAPPQNGAGALRSRALRCGVRGLVGHALVDTLLFTLAFAEPFGLPLASLAKLHLGLDAVVWTVSLAPLLEGEAEAGHRDGLAVPGAGP